MHVGWAQAGSRMAVGWQSAGCRVAVGVRSVGTSGRPRIWCLKTRFEPPLDHRALLAAPQQQVHPGQTPRRRRQHSKRPNRPWHWPTTDDQNRNSSLTVCVDTRVGRSFGRPLGWCQYLLGGFVPIQTIFRKLQGRAHSSQRCVTIQACVFALRPAQILRAQGVICIRKCNRQCSRWVTL